MPFIDFNARATSCNSVVRINFIGVNKLRGGLIQTLKLSMAAILGHVHFSFLNGLWLTYPFSIWHLSLHSEFCILNLGTCLWGSPRLMFSFVPSSLHCYCKKMQKRFGNVSYRIPILLIVMLFLTFPFNLGPCAERLYQDTLYGLFTQLMLDVSPCGLWVFKSIISRGCRMSCRVDRHALFNHLPSVHIIAGSQVIWPDLAHNAHLSVPVQGGSIYS